MSRLDVYYDGLCPLCIRSMTTLRYCDWFQALQFTDLESREGLDLLNSHPELSLDDLRREMHVVDPAGSVTRGFFAFRRIAWRIPLLWISLPLMYLPLAARLGPLAYGRIASRRSRYHACDSDVCTQRR